MQVAKEIALKIKDTINCRWWLPIHEIKTNCCWNCLLKQGASFYYNKGMSLTIVTNH